MANYEQLEPPFQEPDFDDYEEQQAKFLDEPAYDWRTRAEAAEEELETLRDKVKDVRNGLTFLAASRDPFSDPVRELDRMVRMIRQYYSELADD